MNFSKKNYSNGIYFRFGNIAPWIDGRTPAISGLTLPMEPIYIVPRPLFLWWREEVPGPPGTRRPPEDTPPGSLNLQGQFQM
jgi:hypothetical protein